MHLSTDYRRDFLFLCGVCVLFTVLALPGVRYPIVSDTVIYALTGESVWRGLGYTLLGEPYAKHMPLHGILSYPLVFVLGAQWGMKLSSIFGGCGVLLASYALLTKTFSRNVALLAVLFLAIHHGFLFMAMVGSGDLLFTTLFLFSVYAYLRAGEQTTWYLLAGGLAGLASLARYNGVPLFALFGLYALVRRRDHLYSWHFWVGMIGGAALFGLWLLRNFVTFGDPLHTQYAEDFSVENTGVIHQVFANVVFYLNPLHNLLLLFPFALFGLWKQWRRQEFLVLAMCTAWVLTAIWYVQGMRFALPGYPILMGFAVWGFFQTAERFRVSSRGVILSVVCIMCAHFFAYLLYADGAFNAWFDRTIGIVPPYLGVSSEGQYTWDEGRRFVNTYAEAGSILLVDPTEEVVWPALGFFRDDIRLMTNTEDCPAYRITRHPNLETEDVVFVSEAQPEMYVMLRHCAQ